MAKSKNHTSHNQGHKNHRNGIKKPARFINSTSRGMSLPFLKNRRFAKKWNAVKGGRAAGEAAAKKQ